MYRGVGLLIRVTTVSDRTSGAFWGAVIGWKQSDTVTIHNRQA